MKTEELRKGNIVKRGNDVINGLTTLDIHKFDLGQTSLEPISLTEEWLERFGFDKDEEYDEGGLVDYRWALMYRSLEFVSFWNSEELNGVNQPQTGIDVEYVHTLQNLYFALTGEELIWK